MDMQEDLNLDMQEDLNLNTQEEWLHLDQEGGASQSRQIGLHMNTWAELFHPLIVRCHPPSPDLVTAGIPLPLCPKKLYKSPSDTISFCVLKTPSCISSCDRPLSRMSPNVHLCAGDGCISCSQMESKVSANLTFILLAQAKSFRQVQ